MTRKTLLITILILILTVTGCAPAPGPEGPIGPAGPAGPQGPAGPPGEKASVREEYVGAEKCGSCHESAYTKFVLSGHANALTAIHGNAPEFPFDSQTGGVAEPPEGYTWDDIAYVIGGFGWKAAFVDQDGYVIAGNSAYVFSNENTGADAGWVSFHEGEEVVFDCAQCHTTGYQSAGRQNDMPGAVGVWSFEGVQCEVCHGPGSQHTQDPYAIEMTIEYASQACGECHSRGQVNVIHATDGFAEQYTQYNQLLNNEHFAIGCVTCHDPHSSSVHSDATVNPTSGINQTCDTCHWEQAAYAKTNKHFVLDCVDCHMPDTGMSATSNPDRFMGDLSAHIFSINPNPAAPQFTRDGSASMPYLTLDYACKHCHGFYATEKTAEQMQEIATGYHDRPTPEPAPAVETAP